MPGCRVADSHRNHLYCEQGRYERGKDSESAMEIDSMCGHQARLRVMQRNPHGRDHSVYVLRPCERRTAREDPEIVGLGKPGEDRSSEGGDCDGVKSVARDECVHGLPT